MISKDLKQVFDAWGTNFKSFKEMVRGLVTKKSDKTGINNLINLDKNIFKERLDQIILFRYQHYKL